MTNKKQEILEKIKKCMATAGNDASTDGEKESALRLAQILMAKHSVDVTDLDTYKDAKTLEREIGRMATRSFTKKPITWENACANFICEFVGGIKWYWLSPGHKENPLPSKTALLVFYGEKHLLSLATELYNELKIVIAASARAKIGSFIRGKGRNYGDGFVTGIYRKWKDQYQLLLSSNENALILRNEVIVRDREKAAADWIKNDFGLKLSSSPATKKTFDHNAYSRGIADGKNYSLNSQEKI